MRAKQTKTIRQIVDVCMTVLLLCLMAYQVTGEVLHEWFGVGMTVVLLLHHVLNRKWYAALFKGRYSAYRIVTTAVNTLLLASIALTALCGMAMSAHAVSFLYGMLPVSFARQFHLAMSCWSFVLMGVHLGLHLPAMTAGWNGRVKTILAIFGTAIAGVGAWLFYKSGIFDYLFFRSPFAFFDYDKSAVLVFLENLAMLIAFTLFGACAASLVKTTGAKGKRAKKALVPVVSLAAALWIGAALTLLMLASCIGQPQSVQPTATPEAVASNAPKATSLPEPSQAASKPEPNAEPDSQPTEGAKLADDGTPAVYFTSDISAAGLVKIYEALDWQPSGSVAIKISTGEPPASNYLRPELIGDLVQKLNGTIVECNTAYGGSRASAAKHKQVAVDHGFTAIAPFDLLDEDGEVAWPVTGGTRLNRAIVGSHAENYTDWVILSHFKGHAMAGFGGAIKNVAIGMSSASGKVYVHTAGTKTRGSIWYGDQDAWLEALGEMVTGVRDHVGAEHIIYINVMNRLSVDCDCNGTPAEPDMHDIGILASLDPVALDQACVDLVYAAPDGASLIRRIERQHGIHTLEHAEEIGLGSRTYTLINIDG